MKQRIRQFRVKFSSSNRRYLQRLLWRLDETTFPTEIKGLANRPSRAATYFIRDWFVNLVGRRLELGVCSSRQHSFSKALAFRKLVDASLPQRAVLNQPRLRRSE